MNASTGRRRLLTRFLLGGGGLYLLLQSARFGGDLVRHLLVLFALGLFLGQLLALAVEQRFVKHGLGVFRIELDRLFEIFKPLGHACFRLLPVGHSLWRVIHLAIMERLSDGESFILVTGSLIVRTLPIIHAYPIEGLRLGFLLRAFVRGAFLRHLAPLI